MSVVDFDPSPITAWPRAHQPTRPGFWARLHERLYGPDPTGATSGWLTQMRTGTSRLDGGDIDDTRTGRHYADNIPTTLLRRPIAEITATPHHACVDEHLGPLDLGPLEPAHIHDQLIGAER